MIFSRSAESFAISASVEATKASFSSSPVLAEER